MVQERPCYIFSKKEQSVQSPRKSTCLSDISPRKNVCYKYCNKDKCPSFRSNRTCTSDLQKSYYDHCTRDDCPLHKNKTADNTRCLQEDGTCKKITPLFKKSETKSDECKISINTYGEYKYCSCGKPGLYCVCVQNPTKPPPANSKFVATYTHTFTTVKEKATSCSDFPDKNKFSRVCPRTVPCLPCIQSSVKLADKLTPYSSSKSKDVKTLMKSPRDMASSSSASEGRAKKSKQSTVGRSSCGGKCYSSKSRPCSRTSSRCNL